MTPKYEATRLIAKFGKSGAIKICDYFIGTGQPFWEEVKQIIEK